jgi:hypothetical protein
MSSIEDSKCAEHFILCFFMTIIFIYKISISLILPQTLAYQNAKHFIYLILLSQKNLIRKFPLISNQEIGDYK